MSEMFFFLFFTWQLVLKSHLNADIALTESQV